MQSSESPNISPNPPVPPLIALLGGGSVSLSSGQSVTVQFSVARHNAQMPISLGIGSLPTGITAAFSPKLLPASVASQQFSLTLTAAANIQPVKATIEVTASGSGVSPANASVTLTASAFGQVRPLYQLLTVIYAPPGTTSGKGDSQVVYGSGSTTGTTNSASASFKAGVSVTASVGVNLGPVALGGSGQFTASQTTTDSSSVSVAKSSSEQLTVPGPSENGIDHGHDLFYIWMNPLLNVTVGPQKNVEWEMTVDGPTMLVQYVYANWLQDPSLMPQNVTQAFAARGLTTADYAQILACDPFLSGNTAIDPNRFLPTGQSFSYTPPDTASDSAPTILYTQTSATVNTSTQQTQTDYECAVTVSAGIQAPFAATLKVTGSLQWTSTSISGDTAGSSQSATVTVGNPSFGYTGPTDVLVYWDTVFCSFMFAFATESPAASGTITDSTGAAVAHQPVTLAVGGLTLSTFTDAHGDFRFYGAAPGQGTISVGSHKFTIAVGPGAQRAALQLAALS
jgi:hypothetical protein